MRALIVDDDELSLEMLQDVLIEMGHEVCRATNGRQALEMLRTGSIHLVITDWEMPEMSGPELCRAIRAEDFDGYVFIIMLTCRDGGHQKIEGLQAGADSFLLKPLNAEEMLVSLQTAERILGLETRDLAMFALAKLSESRDPETGAHIERVQSFARLLAQHLSTTDRYRNVIDTEFVRLVFQTTPLHDIGKVAIPDSVLLKPGKLSEPEMAVMRTHASMGAQTLEASLQRFPNVQFLQMARDIALSHHERWDGKGYPQQLAGEQIPLSARIVSVADVYDALTSRRVYREAMSHAQAKALIVRERGGQFDPDVVDGFLHTEAQFIAIKQRFDDNETMQVSAQTAKPVDKAVPASRQKVLVVDDDPIVCETLADFLNDRGVDCLLASHGIEAMTLFDAHHPRLVIANAIMPGMDGFELCRRVRASGDAPVQFIMLTADAGENELARIFDAGADDFLVKPFSTMSMMARLRGGLQAIALHEQVAEKREGSRELNEQLANLNQRLERLAITDELTGLYNRHQAMQRLAEQWDLCERYKRPAAVISLDIDHFNQVNDAYGRAAGDSVLREVAETLRQCVRTSDTLCRIGGEEFLIILPCQSADEAEICAQRCRMAIERQLFDCQGQKIQVTLSGGIASWRAEMEQSADLLQIANEAMLDAKRTGGNVICHAAENTVRAIAPAA